MNKKAILILGLAHLITDIPQGSVPALLPFFKEALHLSYTSAGVILLTNNITSSVIQPAFGYLSDRRPMGWFLPLTPLIAGLGVSIAGYVNSYVLLLACIVFGGLGISSFHPEAFKTAHFFLGDKKASAFSLMMVGGNLLGHTRVLTTATVLETGKGNFDIAIALSVILLVMVFGVNYLLTWIQQRGRTS